MNKKSVIAVLLILILAAVSVLGLPCVVRKVEEAAESSLVMVTAAPEPEYADESSEAGL
jgi:hypothetical protein